jgi:WhiB family redox-sensing transcriptional regulator
MTGIRPVLAADTGWMDRGACRGVPGVHFGPPNEHPAEQAPRVEAAKRVCAGCPVRPQCLSYAETRGERHGVWGGLSEEERAGRQRGRVAA